MIFSIAVEMGKQVETLKYHADFGALASQFRSDPRSVFHRVPCNDHMAVDINMTALNFFEMIIERKNVLLPEPEGPDDHQDFFTLNIDADVI